MKWIQVLFRQIKIKVLNNRNIIKFHVKNSNKQIKNSHLLMKHTINCNKNNNNNVRKIHKIKINKRFNRKMKKI